MGIRYGLYKYAGDDDHLEAVDALYFDGYHIGERLLEGLPIKVTLDDAGGLQCTADWPKGLEKAHWSARAAEFAAEYDCFSVDEHLLDDDGVIMVDEAPRKLGGVKQMPQS